MDAETELIVKDFGSILEELTFNSRPIITTLTKIAEENISCAQYFVDCLEARIEKCVPKQKLYAFYAMDSICKNVGSPYTVYFSRKLFALYKKTYLLVDNMTRTKLINMFKTWMSSNGSLTESDMPLFEKTSLDKIEQFLIKASALHQRNLQSILPKPTIPLLLRDIDKLTALTNERLKDQPNDEKLKVKILVLTQLKQELQKEKLAPAALREVQMQLTQVFSQDQQVLQERARYEQSQRQQQQHAQEHQFQQQPSRPQDNIIPLFGNTTASNQNNTSPLFSSMLPALDFSQISRANKKAKLESLYKELDSEGLLFKPSKESVAALYSKLHSNNGNTNSVTAYQNGTENLPPLQLLQNILSDCKAYFSASGINILNTPNLELSQNTLTNDNPLVTNNLIHTIYRIKPKKCDICGKRFGNSLEEVRLQTDHLDWHFRINKRIKGSENVYNGSTSTTSTTQKNIQSRNWYLHDSQWIMFKDEEIVSTSLTEITMTTANLDAHSTLNTTSSTKVTQANSRGSDSYDIDEKVLSRKYVVVPEDADLMSFECPICKESVNATYNEEIGEWTWKNAININSKYFHATCYYEAAKSNNNQGTGLELDMEKLKHLVTK